MKRLSYAAAAATPPAACSGAQPAAQPEVEASQLMAAGAMVPLHQLQQA